MSAKNQRLLWAVLLGVLFFLGDSVLPDLIGRGWTLIVFAAVPFVAGLPFVGRAGRTPSLRWGIVAAVIWYAILFWDVSRVPNPPLPALIPLTAIALATWASISMQAHAAWKRGASGPSV
ncbi:MAG TPA: hypothetical protein VGC13_05610 [Longimicrobium sp.]|jgi:hypothetical protein|uniref:hypothetical protein n=1 Tax=Longimicrobium sp. TaxID=2029185 RepID=UPI002EDA2221